MVLVPHPKLNSVKLKRDGLRECESWKTESRKSGEREREREREREERTGRECEREK